MRSENIPGRYAPAGQFASVTQMKRDLARAEAQVRELRLENERLRAGLVPGKSQRRLTRREKAALPKD